LAALTFVPLGNPPHRAGYLDAIVEGFRVPPDPEPTPAEAAAARADPDRFFEELRHPPAAVRAPNGEDVPVPPTTCFWWVDGADFIGAVQLRHVLNSPFVAAYIGHVGFGVRPSRRGEGQGARMLKAVLPEAAALGIERLMFVARASNKASLRAVEAIEGALFMDELPTFYTGETVMIRRYIIPTR